MRPDCRMKFVTMAGRAKHLGMSAMCKRWWVEYQNALKKAVRELSPDESSSEIGSDEYVCSPNGCDEDIPMELDQEWEGSLSYETCFTQDAEEAEFTSSPSGIDLRSAEVINAAESLISVEEYPGASQVISESQNLFTQIWESDKLYDSRGVGGPFYPFSGLMEWEVVEWLHSLDVPMERIDRFFELEYVSPVFAQ